MNTVDFQDDAQVKEHFEKVRTEYQFQCYHEKKPDGCHRLANFYENVNRDYEKSSQIYRTNCENNEYGRSCFMYSNYKFLGKGCPREPGEALRFAELGCKYESGDACHNAGMFLSDPKSSLPLDFRQSVQHFEKACELKIPESCFRLFRFYMLGAHGIAKQPDKALERSIRGCELGNMYCCANASLMYKKGDGVAQNLQKSDEYRAKAEDIRTQVLDEQPNVTFGK